MLFPIFLSGFRNIIHKSRYALLANGLWITLLANANHHPDQYFQVKGADSLLAYAESVEYLHASADGRFLLLEEGEKQGSIIFKPVTLDFGFDRGLPSWNGTADKSGSAFKVEMRFFIDSSWSEWGTVGFWDRHIWSNYGSTDYEGGTIDIDYVKLDSYTNTFQFKIIFQKTRNSNESPTLSKIAFFASDSEYPIDIPRVLDDNPEAVFIDTEYYNQYELDDDIGGNICSPTSVSMVLQSYNIDIDPLSFAERTYDPYWGIFGVWPRNVAHASEYGLDGSVTRYRTWSEAAEILKNNGRVVMSVGPPMYTGHLIMLAGFDEAGDPIVHDPANRNGYSKIYNKESLSKSWFNKGGIAYTFYKKETPVAIPNFASAEPGISVYPNPVQEDATIVITLDNQEQVNLGIYDMQGRCMGMLLQLDLSAGEHRVSLQAGQFNLKGGAYILRLQTSSNIVSKIILKQ